MKACRHLTFYLMLGLRDTFAPGLALLPDDDKLLGFLKAASEKAATEKAALEQEKTELATH